MKTSLAPGSQVVTEYLDNSGLQKDLDKIGFNLVGYGCTTCIGNSGPLPENISEAIRKNDLVAAAVLSGNRNFEGRVNPDVRANYLASPPLVVAYALAGSLNVDLTKDPIGHDKKGKPVYLKDIWPTAKDIAAVVRKNVTRKAYAVALQGRVQGRQALAHDQGHQGHDLCLGPEEHLCAEPALLRGPDDDAGAGEGHRGRAHPRPVRRLDHHRPHLARRRHQGGIARRQVPQLAAASRSIDFNSYGARRGNHEVMMRGTFANIRIKNQMVPGVEGGVTKYLSGRRDHADL